MTKSVASRGIIGVIWSYAGNTTRLGLQFGIGIVLSRLLGPEPFGIVAIMLILISIGQLFSDFGFSSAIVQAPTLSRDEVRAVSGLQILLGLALTVLTLICAGPIAAFFKLPLAVDAIRAMSSVFLIRSLGQTSTALLTREMRFGAIQLANIGAYSIGYVVIGLPMAISGYGVWSLIIAQVLQAILSTIAVIVLAGGMPLPSLTLRHRSLTTFGFKVINANLTSWAFANLDSLIVGHMFSAITLGYYNRAYSLAGSATQAVTSGLQPVLFAAASRAQENKAAILQIVLASMQLFLLSAGVILAVTSASALTVVAFLYGANWITAADLLRPLALALIAQGVLSFVGPALTALGQVHREVSAQWLGLVVLAVILVATMNVSAVMIAWGVVIAYLVRLCLLLRQLQIVLGFSMHTVAAALVPAIVIDGVAGGAAYAAQLATADAELLYRVVAIALAAGLGTLAAIALSWRQLIAGPIATLARRSPKLARFLDRCKAT